jgi:1-acyl-sn-glycerol-3-phosphate acyltransferase
MTAFVLTLRLLVFYLGFIITLVVISTTGILFLSFARHGLRTGYVLLWNKYVIWSGRWILGLRYEVIGAHNLPEGPYVALAKHQSQWETYFLQYYLAPISTVLKRELLNIPFFGWGLRLTNPIAIDRDSPKQALKQTLALGKSRLAQGNSVRIFTEGSRIPTGSAAKYARGGANIAVAAGVPVVPIALNAGEFWPTRQWLKYPGKITVSIGEAIDSSALSSRDITEQARQWIEGEVATMDKRQH